MYDPKEVTLNVAGRNVTGYAEDSFITAEPLTEEQYQSHVGAAGETGWTKNNDERYKITITLMASKDASGPSIAHLEALSKLPAEFPVMLKNTSDGSMIGAGTKSRVTTRQKFEYGKAAKDLVYTIIVNDWKGART